MTVLAVHDNTRFTPHAELMCYKGSKTLEFLLFLSIVGVIGKFGRAA